MPIDKGTHQGKVCSQNLDEAFCILKVTSVLIEKTLMYIFSKIQLFEVQPRADSESYVRGGPTLPFFSFFLVDEGREGQNTTYAGHHRPASETPFKWRFAGRPIMAQH